jgi:hypothetical protein
MGQKDVFATPRTNPPGAYPIYDRPPVGLSIGNNRRGRAGGRPFLHLAPGQEEEHQEHHHHGDNHHRRQEVHSLLMVNDDESGSNNNNRSPNSALVPPHHVASTTTYAVARALSGQSFESRVARRVTEEMNRNFDVAPREEEVHHNRLGVLQIDDSGIEGDEEFQDEEESSNNQQFRQNKKNPSSSSSSTTALLCICVASMVLFVVAVAAAVALGLYLSPSTGTRLSILKNTHKDDEENPTSNGTRTSLHLYTPSPSAVPTTT